MEDDQSFENHRLGKCEVCDAAPAQYTCPRCELKTCSVDCVKIHKKELNCNGDRDKTAYVPIKKFTNLTLLSDYRLLEDVGRVVDNCKRNPLKRYSRHNKLLPPHLHRLKKEAQKRKIILYYLPQHFTRHNENTTFLHFDTKIIYWRIELNFPQGENLKIILEKCDENERLSSVLSKYLDYEKCDSVYTKKLQYYHSAGLSAVEVLLKAENTKIKPSFFVLDKCSTIKENLEDRIIIEYPILVVILKPYKDEYNILDPDLKVNFSLSQELKDTKNFIPFNYFDTISYSKEISKSDKIVNSINSSAAELRKYFVSNDYEEEMEEVINEEEKNVNNQQKKKKFDIPFYENM